MAVLAEGFTRYELSEPDTDEAQRLMAAASREHLRPCGTFHELTSEIFD